MKRSTIGNTTNRYSREVRGRAARTGLKNPGQHQEPLDGFPFDFREALALLNDLASEAWGRIAPRAVWLSLRRPQSSDRVDRFPPARPCRPTWPDPGRANPDLPWLPRARDRD